VCIGEHVAHGFFHFVVAAAHAVIDISQQNGQSFWLGLAAGHAVGNLGGGGHFDDYFLSNDSAYAGA
jgi:hypothetical protein